MQALVYGSVNIDHVYQLPHFVREGETLSCDAYKRNEGGKGLNQAIALARAGQKARFAGAMGPDGAFLKEYLDASGVDTAHLRQLDAPTGHAVIQVDTAGRNSILLYSGANRMITRQMADETLAGFAAGDWLLMQNEISQGDYILSAASQKGMTIALNPSPITADLLNDWPLELADWFILNEIEGAEITGQKDEGDMLDDMLRRWPSCRVVLTLGSRGAMYADKSARLFQPAIQAKAVDTTAAGDTFTGYFLREIMAGASPQTALKTAAQAAAITVSRPGASRSIPAWDEVERALRGV